jgi:hypothetical protein
MANFSAHDWLIFANTTVESGEASVVTTAVCKQCGDIRSQLSPPSGPGQIDLSGECSSSDGAPEVGPG